MASTIPSFSGELRPAGRSIPERQARRAQRRSLPGGLIGMAGLVFAVECVIAHHVELAHPPSRVALSWRFTACAARSKEAERDVLCFGDSLVKLGILPRVLEKRTGLRASNLAVLAGQAPASLMLLRHILENGHRPKAVVVDFSAPMLSMPPLPDPACWAELADHRDLLELGWRRRDLSLAASIVTRWLCPSWRGREHIRAAVTEKMGTLPDRDSAGSARVFERNWQLNLGAQVAPRSFVSFESTLDGDPETSDWRWKAHPINAAYLDRFLRLAASHRVPVFWVLPPATAAWRLRHESDGANAAHQSFVEGRAARFPGLWILDGKGLQLDVGAFRDAIHLNRDGAVILSIAVADALAKCLSASSKEPRWLALTASPDGSTWEYQHLLEDLDESKAADNQIGETQSATVSLFK